MKTTRQTRDDEKNDCTQGNMNEGGKTVSVWMATADLPLRSPLRENVRCDVCIVGAGISGLTTAYMLSSEGKSVVVLDDGPIAAGETCRTTAHLVNALDDRYFELERYHGAEGIRLAAESHTAAIARVEAIIAQEEIECGFERVDGYLFVPPGESDAVLAKELEATQRAGLNGVERLLRAPLECFDTGPCLRFPDQAMFHPLRYLQGLARAIERNGGRIFNGTHVKGFQDAPVAQVTTTEGRTVSAGTIVVATNSPVNDRVTIHTKQTAYRTYVVGARVPKGSITNALYWDTTDPYHYIRLQKEANDDVLIVGGEDHKTGQEVDTEAAFERLAAWTRERFPMARRFEFRWSGQVMEPVDGLAFIGRNPGDKNTCIITGASGNGMTYGAIGGILLADIIAGRQNPWEKLYNPARISLRAAPKFAKENLNVAAQFIDYLTPGEVTTRDEVKPGEGVLIRNGLKKLAVFRDEDGTLHELSAVCPHLGCIVEWNSTEKTWDCPCHGSRFNACGKVVNGPAIGNMEPVAPDAPPATSLIQR